MCLVFDIKRQVIEASYIREYSRATSHSQEEKLWLHIKQYTPKDNPNPEITIISSHAKWFHKEFYKPCGKNFIVNGEAKSRTGTAGQGQSGAINEVVLGNDRKVVPGSSWLDYAREIYQIINIFHPPPPPTMVIGYSFGANTLRSAALIHPRLLASLVLLEPFIPHFASKPAKITPGPSGFSILIRPSWNYYDPNGKEFIPPELVVDIDSSLNTRWPRHPTPPCPPNVRPSVFYVFGGKSNISTLEVQDGKTTLTGSGVGGSGGPAKGRLRGGGWTRKSSEEKTTLSSDWEEHIGVPRDRNGKDKTEPKI
ncbi:hypothetical protein BKA56DRAFT_633166 [Ilyonectria sp. MPI-CAGE-AT-0026]|nr:hypothetical protein BKA56DRAFT_633166 [Ilyonectria sp. MPI-CAGE-AT-0026]